MTADGFPFDPLGDHMARCTDPLCQVCHATGPAETEAIRRGESSPRIQETAKWLDEEIGPIHQTTEQLAERIDKLERRVTDALERLDRRQGKEGAVTPTA
jgi:hypothetical protein